MSVNRLRLHERADKGDPAATRLQRLLSHPDRFISAILIGNNLVNIAATALGTELAIAWFGRAGPEIATVILTLLILTFGEVLPKSLAVYGADRFAPWVSPFVRLVMVVFAPLVQAYSALSRFAIRRLFPRETNSGSLAREPKVTLDEIKALVSLGAESGALDEEQEDMLSGVVELEETMVSQILLPRQRIVRVSRTATVEQAANLLSQHQLSKLPVHDQDPDNLIGVVYGQDILQALLAGRDHDSIATLVRPILTVPETMKVRRLLEQMRQTGCSMAVAVDEYGTTSGLVTFHDLIGEVLGDIPGDRPALTGNVDEIKQVGPQRYEFSGELPVRRLNRELDLDLPDEGVVTVSGLMVDRLGRLARTGDLVRFGSLQLRAVEVRDRVIRRVQLTLEQAASTSDATTGLVLPQLEASPVELDCKTPAHGRGNVDNLQEDQLSPTAASR